MTRIECYGHGLVKRKNLGGVSANTNALTDGEKEQITLFLKGYAEGYALALPGKMQPFSARDEALLLPLHIRNSFCRRVVSLTCFKRLWRNKLPNLLVARPMTDLCWVCQKLTRARQRHNGMTMEKSEVIKLPTHVHLSHSPMQPGPLYFLVPRKCGLFGVNCEALPQQINFCIDEGVCVGKGSNAVISYLHHFFENHGAGEVNLSLHCDNCAGQNKNQYVLQYLACALSQGCTPASPFHFMLPGHTKFAPDWCFDILKRAFRKAEVHTLQDLANVINTSTKSGINKAVMVGNEKGAIYVWTYDWQSFFRKHSKPFSCIKSKQHFNLSASDLGYVKASFTLGEGQERRLILDPAIVNETGIKSNQHFNLSASDLGYVKASFTLGEGQERLLILDPDIVKETGLSELVPPGLSDQQKAYLFNSIRPFIDESKKGVLCHDPSS
ncbi:hypothetical protein EGW08_021353 [Elysia chlorotica]|uniref:DUF7869 domain-containing protein n=1 Tax=Elysia chlorotica TaxID=188477 RepID=A0A3S0ZB54_ELYCH|nr:hypothetical protein EGW08_021353 [Elysia chlorotica]